jgi:serine/threonine protein phosphatase PrpC
MASTVVALRLDDAGCELAWSGDSRAYFWDGQALMALTRDHSLVESMIARGELTRSEARDHPRRNVILAALGGEPSLPDTGVNSGTPGGDGVFLLCSDGLTDVLDYGEICSIMGAEAPLEARAEQLVARARDAGGRDNITAVLVAVQGTDGDGTLRVYERFEAASGELSWPGDDEAPETPTIRRVRARATDPGITQFAAAPAPDEPPAPPRERPVARTVLMAGVLLSALVLTAAIVFYFPRAGG